MNIVNRSWTDDSNHLFYFPSGWNLFHVSLVFSLLQVALCIRQLCQLQGQQTNPHSPEFSWWKLQNYDHLCSYTSSIWRDALHIKSMISWFVFESLWNVKCRCNWYYLMARPLRWSHTIELTSFLWYICEMMPLKVWLNTALGCNHQSICMPQLCPMHYPGEIKFQVSPVQWSKFHQVMRL